MPGRLVKDDKEAELLEADSVNSVKVIRIADFINSVVATRRWDQPS
jgi:hypothetical protein